jgi:hypothetical protein
MKKDRTKKKTEMKNERTRKMRMKEGENKVDE